MKTSFIAPKAFFSTANSLSIHKITALLILILCFGISPAWGAKPGARLYVNASAADGSDGTSWATAFTDLQSAMDSAVSGDEIWVAAGTYTPSEKIDSSNPRTAAFILKSGVKIYGSFAGDEKQLAKRQLDPSLTVLSGDIGIVGDDTDNSYHVVYAAGVTDAVLDGFTVTGGRGDAPGRDSKGAGMYNYNSAPVVSNCIFSDNRVAVRTSWINGAGAGMYNYNSAPVVSNCIFSDNLAGNPYNNAMGLGGGMYNEGFFDDGVEWRSPLVTGCTFTGNAAPSKNMYQYGGGGMYNYGSSPTVDSCTFAANSAGNGGAVFNFGGVPIIRNSIFHDNFTTAPDGFGGAIFNSASPSAIVNCTFYKNGWRLLPYGLRPYTTGGGAIFDYYRGGSNITNCIFSENVVHNFGGAVGSDVIRGKTTLTNCLFYENKSWQGEPNSSNEVIDHVYGDVDVINSLYDINPLLVDPAGGDFHLRYDSPCIDAGYGLTFGFLPYPYPVGLPTVDFEGDNRKTDGDGDGESAIDIGVDEFAPNLPDLRAFLEALANSGGLDQATAARLIAYVDAALLESDRKAATAILNKLIADAKASLGNTATAQLIVWKTEAVIEGLD